MVELIQNSLPELFMCNDGGRRWRIDGLCVSFDDNNHDHYLMSLRFRMRFGKIAVNGFESLGRLKYKFKQ